MKGGEEKILEGAYKLFREKGVRFVRMQQVARTCGLSLYDLNLKFRTKKELVLAVVKFILNKKSGYLLVNSSLSPSAVAELNNFFKFIDDNIGELSDIFTELKRNHPDVFDQLKELVDTRLIPYLQRIIDRGIDEGFYRNNFDHEFYAPTYFFLLRFILASGNNDWTATRRMISHINDIFLHGALNAKGMRI
jgi:AcrR family transcriptional regulator